MSNQHWRKEDDFKEIARGLGLKWWFIGLIILWVLISCMAGFTFS